MRAATAPAAAAVTFADAESRSESIGSAPPDAALTRLASASRPSTHLFRNDDGRGGVVGVGSGVHELGMDHDQSGVLAVGDVAAGFRGDVHAGERPGLLPGGGPKPPDDLGPDCSGSSRSRSAMSAAVRVTDAV